jgi:hypothetical protein
VPACWKDLIGKIALKKYGSVSLVAKKPDTGKGGNMLQKLLTKFRKPKKVKRVRSTGPDPIQQLGEAVRVTDSHLIALARLSFIKPEVLAREAFNLKANSEYLLKMIEAKKKEEK